MPEEDILDRLERIHHETRVMRQSPELWEATPALIAVARAARVISDGEPSGPDDWDRLNYALDALDALGREGEG